jgi:hypothetical protein
MSYPPQQPYQQPYGGPPQQPYQPYGGPPQPAYGVHGYPQPSYQGGPQPSYQGPPQGYGAPPTVIVVHHQQGGGGPWHSTECDLCAAPGGPGLCLYVVLCQPCAAGDVAHAAGREYLCACLVAPLLAHLAHNEGFGNMIEGCFWAADRRAFAQKFGISDNIVRACPEQGRA